MTKLLRNQFARGQASESADYITSRHAFTAQAFGAETFSAAPLSRLTARAHDSNDGKGDAHTALLPPPGSETQDEGIVNIAVGGSVTGVIDATGDEDTITVTLTAGTTYLISLQGSGASPVTDTFLELFDPTDLFVNDDDDGGNGTYSLITVTPTLSGVYEIVVSAFANVGIVGTGQYTVDVRAQTVDVVVDTPPSPTVITPGTTFGFLETAGDADVYEVHLSAGMFYSFAVAGGADYASPSVLPTGEIDTRLALFDAAGNLLGEADDIDFPDDISSAFNFVPDADGTYYIRVRGYPGDTGGYALNITETDLETVSPLDAIDWGSQLADTTVTVYFAPDGETYDGITSVGWTGYEAQQALEALQTYSQFSPLTFTVVADQADADFTFVTDNDPNAPYLAYFNPPGEPGEGIGVFAIQGFGWDPAGGALEPGGYGWITLIHEIGHGLGLAHPHDNGGTSTIMLGVTSDFGSYGVFDLNQGVYTTMTYNDGWQLHPDAVFGFPDPDTLDYGYQGTPMAFDIAVIQQKYGTIDHNTGDDVYELQDTNLPGTYYQSIWDTGGTDSISYSGSENSFIDLTSATLDYSFTGGGVISWVEHVFGGYTIANGVEIENASGGSGEDQLVGNELANTLSGNAGDDALMGRGGDDTLEGGADFDTAHYSGAYEDYTVAIVYDAGGAIVEITDVTDNETGDGDDGHDTLNDVEMVQFNNFAINAADPVDLYDENDVLVSTHATIQDAIDAALDGYTLRVEAGTFTEDLTIDVDVTILGVNNGIPGTGVRGAETNIDGGILVTANGVTLDGVQISGAITGPNTPPFDSGIYVDGDDFILVNSVLDGPDSAAGILTGSVTGLDVGDNLIQGYAIGIYISTGSSTGSIHDNLFQGDGGPLTGLGNGVNSESSGVLIEHNTFDGLYSGSLNLFPYGPDPVDLETYVVDNTITNSGAARPVQIYPTPDSTYILGTDHDESFRGDAGVTGVSLGYEGRGGNDHAFGGTEADDFSGDEGLDQLFGADGDDTLNGGADNDLLAGEGGIDTAVFADTTVIYIDTLGGWVISSSEGNDFLETTEIVLDGSNQRNLLVGGTAFSTLQNALDEAQTDDNVRLAAGTYSGSVSYDQDGLTVIAQPGAVQNLTYTTSTSFGITIFAADGADNITTADNDDTINGGGGADTLNGGDGNDYIDGAGGGIDHLIGGAGNDALIVDADDTISDISGFDNVAAKTSYILANGSDIEVLSTADLTGTAAINLNGNSFGQVVVGNAGNNYLDGGGGADHLVGLGGDDAIIVDADDTLEEAIGGGFDNVAAKVSYTLDFGDEIEVLSTTNNGGTDAIDLNGNEFGQVLVGNAGDNVLDGKAGNDVLVGLGGADSFAFTTSLDAAGVDQILGFVAADDTILLENSAFVGLAAGALSAGAFATGTAATEADDRIVYNQATGQLYFDVDGNGVQAQVLFAVLQGAPLINASDFTVI